MATQVRVQVPSSVASWSTRPAPFSTRKHGPNVKFSVDNTVAERVGGYSIDDAVVYTFNPVPRGQVWQTTILGTTTGWGTGQVVGVTTTLPDTVPSDLPDRNAGSHEWNYRDRTLFHNKQRRVFPDLPSLNDLTRGQRVGLLVTTNGQLHLFLDGRHRKEIATGLPVDTPLWGAASVFGKCTKIKSEILSVIPELILEAALLDGYILHSDDKFLIHGPGGVGKSSLIAMFLNAVLQLIRISTPVATQPIHLMPIRDVSTSRFTANWERVNYDRLSRMIAHTSHQLFHMGRRVGDGGERGERGREIVSATASTEATQSQAALPVAKVHRSAQKTDVSKLASSFLSKLSKIFKKTSKRDEPNQQQPEPNLATTLEDDPEDITGLFAEFQRNLRDLIAESKGENEALLTHSIHLVDSGGQPQFHDIISIFMPGLSGLVSVFKLSECFSAHGEVALYNSAGELINEPYESHYTHEHVIREDLLAIQCEASHCGTDEMPNLAFVGTFLDEKHKCPEESPEAKDERLHSIITEMLPPEMLKCVITDGPSLKQATFRINARTPTKRDFDAVGRLRAALISRSRVRPRKLPLNWYGYEVALHQLMQELGRQVLSRRECEYVAHMLGFDHESLKAALHYLQQLNIIAYYDMLPGVVFGSSQVVLDKITELVRYSLQLKKGRCTTGGAERKFLQQGIVSLEFLSSPDFSKHYISQLFGPEEVLKVLTSLLVVAKVGAREYIMPCVLEVSCIYPTPPVPDGNVLASFIIHFSKKSPMFGVYCCTTSSLMSDTGWRLLTEGGEVAQVARNSITFEMPRGYAGKVTILDPLSSYLEVTVQLPVHIAKKHSTKLYPEIRDTFLAAVKKAMATLHYEARVPEVSFLCPEQSKRCSVEPHVATVDGSQSSLICSLRPGSVCHPLTEEQRMWLPAASGQSKKKPSKKKQTAAEPAPPTTGDPPSLPELLRFKIPRQVGADYTTFGIFLLDDVMGSRVDAIEDECRGNPNRITRKILQEWVGGRGAALTWDTLVKTLRNCELNTLADHIQASKLPHAPRVQVPQRVREIPQSRPAPPDSEPPQLTRTAPPDSEPPQPSRPAPPDSEPQPTRPAPPDSEPPQPSRPAPPDSEPPQPTRPAPPDKYDISLEESGEGRMAGLEKRSWETEDIHSSPEKMGAPIRGADIVARTTVTLAAGCTYKWKGHGLKLTVPADALEPLSPPATITIQASLSGRYHLPDHTQLVSGVYWISFPGKFSRPVTLEVQHCASLQHAHETSSLSFVTARCNQETLPYNLKPITGGIFSADCQFGTIELSHFSCFAVLLKKMWRRRGEGTGKRYVAITYYIPQVSRTTWLVHLPIISDLDLCIKAVQAHYQDKQAEEGPDVKVTISGSQIAIDVPEAGIKLPSGWNLEPLVTPQLTRANVESYKEGQKIPCFQLELEWTGIESQAQKLSHVLHFSGVEPQDTFIRITRTAVRASPDSQQRLDSQHSEVEGTSGQRQRESDKDGTTAGNQLTMNTLGDAPSLPELLRLELPERVGNNYSNFGIFLLEDRTGNRMDAIEDEYRGKPERITRKILQEWVGGRGAALTWETLVKTLRDCKLIVSADEVQASKLPHTP